jgi:Zn-dependent alcohol dehydrogenase
MKALVLNALGRGCDLDEVDIASSTGREVFVDVQASGRCHTDLFFATHDIAPTPSVLGHEVAEIVGADLERARRVASQIRAGRVVINGVTDDPQAPWGGFKFSGVGREYGRYGIQAFLETRAILES